MAKRTVQVAELDSLVGETLRSRWLDMTQDRVDAFAESTLDDQWLHTDPDRAAKESPFGTTIAHGYLTLALVPALLFEVLEVTGATLVINYGANKVRFPAPVPVGSRIRLAAEVAAVDEVKGGFQMTLAAAIEVEGAEKPAMAAELLYRWAG